MINSVRSVTAAKVDGPPLAREVESLVVSYCSYNFRGSTCSSVLYI